MVAFTTDLSAELIPVKQKEGGSHGFIELLSVDGHLLATGDMIQTIEGKKVTSEIVLHFKDGSVHDEVAVFSQDDNFRLLTDHIQQKGPSFPNPTDTFIDAAEGRVKIHTDQNGDNKDEEHQLQIPEDIANGMTLVLLKNLAPSHPETTVSMVTTSAKPRMVKLKIHSESEGRYLASGSARKANHYVVHVDIGGLAGVVAHVIGKQPPDTHVWLSMGKAPTFVRFEGPLYEGGPIWTIALAPVKWEESANAKRTSR